MIMRNLKQRNYYTKLNPRPDDSKIQMAYDCLFSPFSKLELEKKWKLCYPSIFKYTKKYNFEYFKKQKLNKSLSKQESLLVEYR